jgi:DNA-binding XRE family transcriptional regulator
MAARDRDQDALSTFVEELKAYRADRGWSQEDLATHVNYSEALIAQVGPYRKIPTMQLATMLDRVFGTPGFIEDQPGKPGTPGTFTRLAARIRRLSFPVAFRPFTEAEEEATALYIFEPALFPGLFQAEPYARTVLASHPGATAEQVTARLAARLSRQSILIREAPPHVWLLLYEPVLRNLVDSPQTMYDQFMKALEASRRTNVTAQVLPAGLRAAHKGSFHIAENVGLASTAYVEDVMDGRTTQDPVILNELSERFRYLQIEAMTPTASREFMEKVAKETWSEP